jgi:uncharacterized protein
VKYLYTIPYQDKFIVYRPLKRLAFVANAALVNLIAKINTKPRPPETGKNEDAFRFLEATGFLEPDPPAPLAPSIEEPYKPTVAVLFLTTACNFRCIYCYASGGETKVQNLPFVLGCRAIDRVCQNATENGENRFTVAFHGGGEPTLARKNFKDLIKYAKAKETPCHITVASNGFWAEEQREWILNHVDDISLSFDGIEEIQDRQRPLASGQGSYHVVMKAIRAMDQRGFPYGIRMTVTDKGIDFVARSIEFFCNETSSRTFQMEPAFNHGRAQQDGLALTQNDRFASAFMGAYDIATSSGRHLYYSGARPWVITSRFCQSPEKALVVTPRGFLTACYEVYSKEHLLAHGFFFGKLLKSGLMDIDFKARQRFFEKLRDRRALCEACFCYWHCAGDCPSKTFTPEGNGHLRFGERCDLNRMITRELVIRYITAGNGIWQWKGQEERPFLEMKQ